MSGQPRFDPETVDLDAMLKRLHLANTRRLWRVLCERAEAEQWSPRHLLAVIVAEEIAHRRNTRLQREASRAGFPFLKTVEDFDFTLQSTLKLSLLGSYLGPELVSEGRCLILQGKTGRGKTHMAIAIAYRAIQNGFTARFVTAAALIDELSTASRSGKFRAVLTAYTQPSVLVVDEVGYLSYGPDAANVLFHVVNDRHTRKRPMIFTTNKSPFTQWGDALHDHDLADALVDRVLERGRLVLMDGPSYRTRHLPVDPNDGRRSNEAARISGIDRTEFPEPASPFVPFGCSLARTCPGRVGRFSAAWGKIVRKMAISASEGPQTRIRVGYCCAGGRQADSADGSPLRTSGFGPGFWGASGPGQHSGSRRLKADL